VTLQRIDSDLTCITILLHIHSFIHSCIHSLILTLIYSFVSSHKSYTEVRYIQF